MLECVRGEGVIYSVIQ